MVDGASTETENRRSQLAGDLESERSTSHDEARKLESRIACVFWVQMVAGGIASLMGLTRFEWVQPWMVSLAAAVATAGTVVVRETKWRVRADWFYARRDMAASLLNRLNYEMPDPITNDNIAAISKEFRQRRDMLGLRMTALNAGATPAENKVVQPSSPPNQ